MQSPKMTIENPTQQDFLEMSEPTQVDDAFLRSLPSVPVIPQPSTADVPAAVGVSREAYDDAWVENSHRDFAIRIAQARAPAPKPVVLPCVAPGVAEATRREMEAGAKRVAQFAEAEAHRRVIPRKKEPWEGNSTPVFRPIDFIPDPSKYANNNPSVIAVS